MEDGFEFHDSSLNLYTNPDPMAYFTDDSSSIFHSSLSLESSFDGMSSVSSPTHSTSSTISPSKSNTNDVSCDNQGASTMAVGFSKYEQVATLERTTSLFQWLILSFHQIMEHQEC